eukprot:gene3375-6692_t
MLGFARKGQQQPQLALTERVFTPPASCVKGYVHAKYTRSMLWKRMLHFKGGTVLYDNINQDADIISQLKNPSSASIKEFRESLQLYHSFKNCNDSIIGKDLQLSLTIIADALRLYGPINLFSSFNGGKDAVVVMHLFRAAIAKYSVDHGIIYQPQFIYFAIQDEFDE